MDFLDEFIVTPRKAARPEVPAVELHVCLEDLDEDTLTVITMEMWKVDAAAPMAAAVSRAWRTARVAAEQRLAARLLPRGCLLPCHWRPEQPCLVHL